MLFKYILFLTLFPAYLSSQEIEIKNKILTKPIELTLILDFLSTQKLEPEEVINLNQLTPLFKESKVCFREEEWTLLVKSEFYRTLLQDPIMQKWKKSLSREKFATFLHRQSSIKENGISEHSLFYQWIQKKIFDDLSLFYISGDGKELIPVKETKNNNNLSFDDLMALLKPWIVINDELIPSEINTLLKVLSFHWLSQLTAFVKIDQNIQTCSVENQSILPDFSQLKSLISERPLTSDQSPHKSEIKGPNLEKIKPPLDAIIDEKIKNLNIDLPTKEDQVWVPRN